MDIQKPPPCVTATVLALLLLPMALAAAPRQSPADQAFVVSPCRQAVADSRMVCLSASDCQREVSAILRACHSSDRVSCGVARQDMLAYCSSRAPWYDTRQCKQALQRVSHDCGR